MFTRLVSVHIHVSFFLSRRSRSGGRHKRSSIPKGDRNRPIVISDRSPPPTRRAPPKPRYNPSPPRRRERVRDRGPRDRNRDRRREGESKRGREGESKRRREREGRSDRRRDERFDRRRETSAEGHREEDLNRMSDNYREEIEFVDEDGNPVPKDAIFLDHQGRAVLDPSFRAPDSQRISDRLDRRERNNLKNLYHSCQTKTHLSKQSS